jgi:hypothetical protein
MPSTRSGEGNSSSSAAVPTSPRVEPSTDASTSVFWVGRPSNTRASSRRAAVSAALPVASGTTAASRAATTTTWWRERPARRPTTFRSDRPAWVKSRCEVRKPRDCNCVSTKSAVRRSPGRPGRRSGSSAAIVAALVAASRPSKSTSAASPCPKAPGRLCRENMVRTSANSAGTNAAR